MDVIGHDVPRYYSIPFSLWQKDKPLTKISLYSFLVKTSSHSITAKLTKYKPSGLWNL
jgi:hypothetical protein